MTNDQAKRLKDAIAHAFSDHELTEFLTTALNHDLSAAIPPGSRDSRASELVARARRHGEDAERSLAAAVQQARPQSPPIQAITAEILGPAGQPPSGPASDRHIASPRILRHAPRHLFGRDDWLRQLDDAWHSHGATRVLALVAWGGAGKTSLVAHWVADLARRDWPDVQRYFDWSFYSQGAREHSQASADFFIAQALAFFGDPDPQAGTPWQRGERLAALVRRRRTLLVLDGIEPLQYPPNSPTAGHFKDDALAAMLQGLALDNPGLCVATSRETLTPLHPFHGRTVAEKALTRLPRDAALALLRPLGVQGPDKELAAAWREASGHALTLQLLGRYLADAHGSDIRRRQEVHLAEADRDTPGHSAMKVLRAYETWLESAGPERQRDLAVLRLTGLFDRPADPSCLSVLRSPPAISGLTDALVMLKEPQWRLALKDLEQLELVALTPSESGVPSSPALDAHPLVREYFADQLRRQHPEAFRAAHSRLFDHLCQSTPHRPDTLAALQPLYQAVTHGCLAGRHPEAREKVYRDRILRGTGDDGFYSWKKLGAVGADLGAVAAFFEEPWSKLSSNLSAPDQAWLLAVAAFHLRALGRLTEALDPMRAGLDRRVETDDWENAAISASNEWHCHARAADRKIRTYVDRLAQEIRTYVTFRPHDSAIRASNLSELEVTLGRLGEALADARRAIAFADRSRDAFEKMAFRTTAADALHQSGARAEAGSLFAEAERLQAERQPHFPRLYSLWGFRYADLLLAPAERAAWAAWPSPRPAPQAPFRPPACRTASLLAPPPSPPAPRPNVGRIMRSRLPTEITGSSTSLWTTSPWSAPRSTAPC